MTKMEEFLDAHTSAYSAKYMKTKLKEYFGDRIIIAEINGKADVVTFLTTASTILQEYHKQRKDGLDTESEKMCIIETAAKLSVISSLSSAIVIGTLLFEKTYKNHCAFYQIPLLSFSMAFCSVRIGN